MSPRFDMHAVSQDSGRPWSDTHVQIPKQRHGIPWFGDVLLWGGRLSLCLYNLSIYRRTEVNWSGVTILLKVNALNNFTIFLTTLASSLSNNITMAWNENSMSRWSQGRRIMIWKKWKTHLINKLMMEMKSRWSQGRRIMTWKNWKTHLINKLMMEMWHLQFFQTTTGLERRTYFNFGFSLCFDLIPIFMHVRIYWVGGGGDVVVQVCMQPL